MIFWLLFILLICLMVAIDLRFDRKKGPHEPSFAQSATWTLIWISTALIFNLGLYWLYEGNFVHPASSQYAVGGREAVLLFFTGYLVEKSLSLDNIFVIAMIFSYFQVPATRQHRVLLWGILGAIILRFAMILGGSALIQQFSFTNYLFGGILLFTALKMLMMKEEAIHPEKNPLIRLAKRFFNVTHEFHGEKFFVKLNDRWAVTPLFLSLLVVETTDVLFAVDSIPAIFSITTDPFLVFTSNIFAILGLRSLYFLLAIAINRFYYLRFSLVFLLAFVGVKMITVHSYPMDSTLSLLIILGILSIGVIASLIPEEPLATSYQAIRNLAIVTARDLRRITILIGSILLLIVGVLMLVLPGPGLLVIPIALLLLSREFHWAKRLFNRLKRIHPFFQKVLGRNDDNPEK